MLTTESRNPSSTDKKSGIQYLEPGILRKIWIQNPSSTDTDWNPVPGIRNPLRGIQNPRLSSITLHRAESVRFKVMLHETIRNNDFQRNTALQCWNNVATIWSNVATML